MICFCFKKTSVYVNRDSDFWSTIAKFLLILESFNGSKANLLSNDNVCTS